MITIDDISKSLSDGQLVVFIGAGVSRGTNEERGLPTASDILSIFAKKYEFIANSPQYKAGSLRFEEACSMLRSEKGANVLVGELAKIINKNTYKPLQSHKLLAKLPFSAYFSVNFDQLLERACSEITEKCDVIIQDKDVAFWESGNIPIIKLHGCISNRESIIAAIEDYKPFKDSKPLIDAMSKTFIASKRVLFLGFSLKDSDFIELYNELLLLLGDYMNKSMAVVNDPNQNEVKEWEKKGVTVINYDLTDFLHELAKKQSNVCDVSNFIASGKSIYLKKLHEITDCPTETIAIDVFLSILINELDSDQLYSEIVKDFKSGYEAIFFNKPNFLAFKHECEDIIEIFEKHCNKCEVKNALSKISTERKQISNEINSYGKTVILPSSQILIYSQSVRVLDFLKSVSADIQRSCRLYICECRAKSALPFYDASQILNNLADTFYEKIIITDSSISYLFKNKQIDVVVMGAHAVYMNDGVMKSFVNTSGSDIIIHEATRYDKPVYVIAEKKKTKEWEPDIAEEIKFTEGEFITKVISHDDIKNTIEVAYDLCERSNNTIYISEDGIDK